MLLTCLICLEEFEDDNFFDSFFQECNEKIHSANIVAVDVEAPRTRSHIEYGHRDGDTHPNFYGNDGDHVLTGVSSLIEAGGIDNILVRISNKCYHSFCIECLSKYCMYTVNALESVPIPCPKNEKHAIDHSNGSEDSDSCCSSFLSDKVVRRIMIVSTVFQRGLKVNTSLPDYWTGERESFWNSYVKLLIIRAASGNKEKYVTCPRCDDLVYFCPESVVAEATEDLLESYEVFSSGASTTITIQKPDAANVVPMYLNQSEHKERKRGESGYGDGEKPSLSEALHKPITDADENGTVARTSTLSNFVTCTTCHHSFCGYHGDGHKRTTSCLQYVTNPDYLASTRLIQRSSKNCSHCSAPISKVSGCNHVVCAVCKNDMCYTCNSHLHLSGTMIRSCSKCKHSYRDHRYDRQYKRRLCFLLPVLVPFIIFYTTLSVTITLLSGCFCCFFHCGSALQPREKRPQSDIKLDDTAVNTSNGSHNPTRTLDRVEAEQGHEEGEVNDIERGEKYERLGTDKDDQGIDNSDEEVMLTRISTSQEKNRQPHNEPQRQSRENLKKSIKVVTTFVFFPLFVLLYEFGLIPTLNGILNEEDEGNEARQVDLCQTASGSTTGSENV